MGNIVKSVNISWVNIVLLTINVCFIVAFSWYLVASETKLDSRMKSNSNDFLKKELKFTEDQYNSINSLDKENFRKKQIILKLICQQKHLLYNQIIRENPSSDSLNIIIKKTTHFYQALNKQSVKHLLNIKKVCTSDQKNKMNEILKELIGIDNQCKYCIEKCENRK